MKCPAYIRHGPGHQSTTYCHKTDVGHKVHETYYGSRHDFAMWEGKSCFSGFFDEPPIYNPSIQDSKRINSSICCKEKEREE